MEESSAIKIAVRERPAREIVDEKDEATSVVSYHSANRNILVVDDRPFAFDIVLSPFVSQQQLFDELIKPLVGKVMQGFNCTALAYGQTGTGKSYTMGLNYNNFEGENVGIIPRCLKELFCNDENTNKSAKRREIFASFIEIYNEKVFDLLAENSNEPIASRGYKFTGGLRKEIANIQDCYSILSQGNKNRHVRPTKMNSQSSRSHAIFSIHVRLIGEEQTVAACLNLVDLAGSEGVRRTGHQGVAMSEGVHINQGLLTIGKVLQAMTLGYKVIPYRDSVLSSVLQDSLNPNSYLTLLACISPHREDLSETLSTLRFAQNAKQLKHSPQINTILADIKKNKVKTPYKSNALKTKYNASAAATPSERLHSVQKSLTKNSRLHSNTFCTPSKMRKIDSNKFNQTEMIVPFRANQRHQPDYCRASEFKINSAFNTASNLLELNQKSLFDKHNDTLDSRSSLFSLNISTSTTVDTATKNSVSNNFSPVVRKCMDELEKMMDNKMSQMIETFKSVHSKDIKTISPTQLAKIPNTSTALETPVQLLPSTLRLELTSIVKELLDRSVASNNNDCIISAAQGESSYISKTTTQSNAKCKLFATSSPVFKVPEIPAALTIDHDNTFIPLEDNSMIEDLMHSFTHASGKETIRKPNNSLLPPENNSTIDDLMDSFAHGSEQTVRMNRVRRSQRLSTGKLNNALLDENTNFLQLKRRSARLASVKELNVAFRRSIRLASQPVTKETKLYEDNHVDKQINKQKSSHKNKKTVSSLINNSVIASYFKTKSDQSPKYLNKVQKISKHKKAILDMLNKGSMKELQLLPQVGLKTAYQLVTQRTLNGKFKNLAQVEKLPIWRGNAWERFAKANMLL